MDEQALKSRTSEPTEWVYFCDRCGERMEERKCKIICNRCGFHRDCSDP